LNIPGPLYHKLNIFILTLVVLITGCSSHKHLAFENIPVDGNLETFLKEMEGLGFQKERSYEKDQAAFSGVYCEKPCGIIVSTTPKSKTVYRVVVNLQKETHDSIKATYERLKKRCALNYGEGASIYQQFHNSPRFLFNEPKLVREPKPGDYTRFMIRSGTIFLEVRLDYLSITYIDRKNNLINKKEGGKENDMETPDI